MFVTIISDCQDDNALGRQATRIAALFGSDVTAISPIGVSTELEAAGNLVDVLDAADGANGIVLVNVAPRGAGARKKGWENGSPFCYFVVGGVTVISSIGTGITLALVKKLEMAEKVHILDIPTVMQWAVERRLIKRDIADSVIHSQFRSFEFLPRAALWLYQKEHLPAQTTDIFELTKYPDPLVWWVDNFDNCKTTLLYEELGKIRESDFTEVRNLPFYPRLRDVPQGTLAWVIGSSGFGADRFLEIVLKGGRATSRIPQFMAWSMQMSLGE